MHQKPGGLPKNLAQHASAGSQTENKSQSPGGAAEKCGTANLGCPPLPILCRVQCPKRSASKTRRPPEQFSPARQNRHAIRKDIPNPASETGHNARQPLLL